MCYSTMAASSEVTKIVVEALNKAADSANIRDEGISALINDYFVDTECTGASDKEDSEAESDNQAETDKDEEMACESDSEDTGNTPF